MNVAHPGTFALRTCISRSDNALERWEYMINLNRNGIDAWVTHSWYAFIFLLHEILLHLIM
jgi:hypothetical protein